MSRTTRAMAVGFNATSIYCCYGCFSEFIITVVIINKQQKRKKKKEGRRRREKPFFLL